MRRVSSMCACGAAGSQACAEPAHQELQQQAQQEGASQAGDPAAGRQRGGGGRKAAAAGGGGGGGRRLRRPGARRSCSSTPPPTLTRVCRSWPRLRRAPDRQRVKKELHRRFLGAAVEIQSHTGLQGRQRAQEPRPLPSSSTRVGAFNCAAHRRSFPCRWCVGGDPAAMLRLLRSPTLWASAAAAGAATSAALWALVSTGRVPRSAMRSLGLCAAEP